MAMQVEVGTPLASLVNLSERRSGATLQHAFIASLSEPGGQPREPVDERPPYGNPVRPANMPPALSRPRLTPKPFSREHSSDAFAMVKPPVPFLKPSSVAPKASPLGQRAEGVAEGVGSAGNVPPLLDQQAVRNKSPRELVVNVPICAGSPANTVILFESGRTEEPGQKTGPPERPSSTSQAPKGRLLPSELEASHRRPEGAGALHRQSSLSSEPRPAAWTPRRPVERKETFSGVLEERAKDTAGEQGRPKPRPVSAFFLESLKDPKQDRPEVPGEPLEPEKPWARKPRPLSMDLTARFESREVSARRKPGLPENKDRNPGAHLVDTGDGVPLQTGEAASSGATDSKSGFSGAAADTDASLGVQSKALQKLPPAEAPALDLSPVSARDRKHLWEQRLKSQEEPKEREAVIAATSEKSKEPPRSKGQPAQDQATSDPPKTGGPRGGTPEAAGNEDRRSRAGGVQKAPGFPDSGGKAPAKPASSLESAEKGSRVLNIQQRIRELTADSPEAKPGNVRRSFRSRPLSADLTKLFSSPAATGEGKPERQPESNRKPASEMEDLHEKEGHPPCEAGSREGPSAGKPWKPLQVMKRPLAGGHPEREGTPPKEQQDGHPQHSDGPTLASSHDVKAPSTPPAGSTGIKTVRATMFEHTVQRLSVAARPLGPELPLQPERELVGGPSGPSWESGLERVLDARETSRIVPSKQADGLAFSEPHKKAKPISGDKILRPSLRDKWNIPYEKPMAKHIEDSLVYQRIEPRYEILQTVGERVQSEAVAAVPGEKAVTLRSKTSLKEQKKAGSGHAAWPQSLDVNGDTAKEDGFVPRLSNVGEGAAKTHTSKELDATHAQATEQSKNRAGQQPASVKASHSPNRSKGAMATDDRGSRLPLETEKGKSEAGLAGKSEGPERLKPFPASLGVGTGGAASAGQGLVPFLPSEHRNPPPPLHRTAPEQRFGSKDPNTTHEEPESRGSGRKASLAAYGVQESHASDANAGGGQVQPPDPVAEGRARRSFHPVSSPKASDRWRRKTMPHGAASFEELAQEKVRPLSRRDSLLLQDGALARRSARARAEAEPTEGSVPSPSRPGSGTKSPLAPSDGKATYFALTGQRPDEKDDASKKPFQPLGNKQAPSLTDEASATLGSRRSQPGQPPLGPHFQDVTPGSLDRPLSRSRGDPPELAGRGAWTRPAAQVSAEGRRRRLEGAEERVTAVELRPPPHLRALQRDSRQAGPTDQSRRGSKGQAGERSRPRVLDLDLLMAEYQEGSKTVALAPEKGEGPRPPRESGWFPWEQREAPASERSSGLGHQGGSLAKSCPLKEGERWPAGYGGGSSPVKARETTFTPLHWGRPGAEIPKGSPTDHVGARKKTFILDEEPVEGLRLWHQSAWGAGHSTQALGPVGAATEPVSAGGALLPTGGSAEESWHPNPPVSGANKRRAGSSLEKDPSRVQSGAETPSTAPGLSGALADPKRSSLGKVHPAGAKGGLPFGGPTREWQMEEGRAAPSLRLESAASQTTPRRSLSPCEPFVSRGNKQDQEDEQAIWGRDGSGPLQRRSRSLYKERRTGRATADQLKQCFGRPATGAKDTDTLVHQEADSQYGTWSEQRLSGDSFVPESPSSEGNLPPVRRQLPGSRPSSFSSQTDPTSTTDPHDDDDDSSRDRRSASLDRSSTDAESSAEALDLPAGPAARGARLDFSFLDQTPVLDSSALKTRVQLSKRRRQHRAPISHSLRRSTLREDGPPRSGVDVAESAWMFKDSTGEKSAPRGESDEEGKPPPAERPPFSHSQRLPVFPGMDHLALKAQLRKRHEPEAAGEGPSAQPSRSPKSPLQAGPSGGRTLPKGPEREERAEGPPSPQWLKELRSRKRQSQYEDQV
uniref:Uncharacterized protein KIAA1671 homolog isoform X1 n=1 Tax=Pogona vitticeps TaxID=103695 RepID=A0ABM5F278_9SAUR